MEPISVGAAVLGSTALNNILGFAAAKRQMGFQADMSSTSYQRAVQDLKAADLNPMLAYGQGGASTPSGAMPNISDVGAAVSTALQAKSIEAQVAQAESQASLNNQNTQLARAQTWTEQARTNLVNQQAAQAQASAGQAMAMQQQIGQTIRHLEELIQTEPHRRAEIAERVLTEPVRRALFGDQAGQARSQTHLNLSTAKLQDVLTVLRQLDVPQGEAQSQFYSGAVGENAPLINQILRIISVLKR